MIANKFAIFECASIQRKASGWYHVTSDVICGKHSNKTAKNVIRQFSGSTLWLSGQSTVDRYLQTRGSLLFIWLSKSHFVSWGFGQNVSFVESCMCASREHRLKLVTLEIGYQMAKFENQQINEPIQTSQRNCPCRNYKYVTWFLRMISNKSVRVDN